MVDPFADHSVDPNRVVETLDELRFTGLGLEDVADHALHLVGDHHLVRCGKVLQAGGDVDGQPVDGIVRHPVHLTAMHGDPYGHCLAGITHGLDGKCPDPLDQPEGRPDRPLSVIATGVRGSEQGQETVALDIDDVSTEVVADRRPRLGNVTPHHQHITLELVTSGQLGRTDQVAEHDHHPWLPAAPLLDEELARRVIRHRPVRESQATQQP